MLRVDVESDKSEESKNQYYAYSRCTDIIVPFCGEKNCEHCKNFDFKFIWSHFEDLMLDSDDPFGVSKKCAIIVASLCETVDSFYLNGFFDNHSTFILQ